MNGIRKQGCAILLGLTVMGRVPDVPRCVRGAGLSCFLSQSGTPCSWGFLEVPRIQFLFLKQELAILYYKF